MSTTTIQNEVNWFVEETVIDYLTDKFKYSKFKPKGGFRRGFGFSYKIMGKMDINPVFARFMEFDGDTYIGRLGINTLEIDTYAIDKRFNRIIKLLDGTALSDVLFNFELVAAGGHSYWFKFIIQN